jgi:hypothetical protein
VESGLAQKVSQADLAALQLELEKALAAALKQKKKKNKKPKPAVGPSPSPTRAVQSSLRALCPHLRQHSARRELGHQA